MMGDFEKWGDSSNGGNFEMGWGADTPLLV